MTAVIRITKPPHDFSSFYNIDGFAILKFINDRWVEYAAIISQRPHQFSESDNKLYQPAVSASSGTIVIPSLVENTEDCFEFLIFTATGDGGYTHTDTIMPFNDVASPLKYSRGISISDYGNALLIGVFDPCMVKTYNPDKKTMENLHMVQVFRTISNKAGWDSWKKVITLSQTSVYGDENCHLGFTLNQDGSVIALTECNQDAGDTTEVRLYQFENLDSKSGKYSGRIKPMWNEINFGRQLSFVPGHRGFFQVNSNLIKRREESFNGELFPVKHLYQINI